MNVTVITLFPELFDTFKTTSFVGRAADAGQLVLALCALRDFGIGKHKSVDDTPYGGGSGMVMRVDVLVASIEAVQPRPHRILLTPQGRPFDQDKAIALAKLPSIMLVCGRYEGFDERIRKHVDEEISLGDFVMTGGEVAAMAVIESVVRLLPGVLGNEASTHEESHSPGNDGLLEYPQYTRPADFRGDGVPPELLSGNHAEIAAWRAVSARARTAARRPDLLAKSRATKA
jgi:tRNA (guanine37-N1)-methyltransferase